MLNITGVYYSASVFRAWASERKEMGPPYKVQWSIPVRYIQPVSTVFQRSEVCTGILPIVASRPISRVRHLLDSLQLGHECLWFEYLSRCREPIPQIRHHWSSGELSIVAAISCLAITA